MHNPGTVPATPVYALMIRSDGQHGLAVTLDGEEIATGSDIRALRASGLSGGHGQFWSSRPWQSTVTTARFWILVWVARRHLCRVCGVGRGVKPAGGWVVVRRGRG